MQATLLPAVQFYGNMGTSRIHQVWRKIPVLLLVIVAFYLLHGSRSHITVEQDLDHDGHAFHQNLTSSGRDGMDAGDGLSDSLAKRVTLLPAGLTQQQLDPLVRTGYCFYTALMHDDINAANERITLEAGPDPQNTQWQRYNVRQGIVRSWTSYDTTAQLDAEIHQTGIKEALEHEMVDPVYAGHPRHLVRMDQFPIGPNIRLTWRQDKVYKPKSYGPQDRALPPTQAVYETAFNIPDGVIVAQKMYGPRAALAAQPDLPWTVEEINQVLPVYNKWSDLAFGDWWNQHHKADACKHVWRLYGFRQGVPTKANKDDLPIENEMGRLNLMVAQYVKEADTLPVVMACLHGRKQPAGVIPPYPGERFLTGHWCFSALLTTESGQPFVSFLIDHKKDLGHKVFLAVTIFKGNNPATDYPSLMWEVVPYAQGRVNLAATRNGRGWVVDPPAVS